MIAPTRIVGSALFLVLALFLPGCGRSVERAANADPAQYTGRGDAVYVVDFNGL